MNTLIFTHQTVNSLEHLCHNDTFLQSRLIHYLVVDDSYISTEASDPDVLEHRPTNFFLCSRYHFGIGLSCNVLIVSQPRQLCQIASHRPLIYRWNPIDIAML